MKTAVEGSESATEQSLRERYNISDEPEGQEPEGSESAPASEPETDRQDRKPLTDEEKAERKRRNDERRERRWYEERGEMRAEMRRLREEVETLRTNPDKRESTPARSGQPTFKAILQTHLDSGKHKTYEDALSAAQDEYLDAREAKLRERFESESSAKNAQRTVSEHRAAYDKDAREFSKTHDDYDDVYAEVATALDTRDSKGDPIGNAVTRAIITSKSPAALIYHLGNNPELLDELRDLLEDDEEAAAVRLGEIRASLRREAAPDRETKPQTTGASRGRTSTRISARGGGGASKEDQLREAANKGDFAAFQAINRKKG